MEGKEERYQLALQASRDAYADYHAARILYREGKINDQDFLAVREKMTMAQVNFDVAEMDLKYID